MKKDKITKIGIVMAIAVIILMTIDQVFKILTMMYIQDPIILLENVLQIDYVRNTGVAFGMAQNHPFIVILIQIMIVAIVIRFGYIQYERMNKR